MAFAFVLLRSKNNFVSLNIKLWNNIWEQLKINSNKNIIPTRMKKLMIAAFVAVAGIYSTSAQVAPAPENKNAPVITFDKEVHDFGNVALNQPASYTFTFKNTGKEPLIITNAAASCGCTTPEWTKEPIMPGKKGFVKATYNSASMGVFNKAVNVSSNAKNANVTLYIKGDVKPADQITNQPGDKTIKVN